LNLIHIVKYLFVNRIMLYNPGRVVFGQDSLAQMAEDYLNLGLKHLFVLTVPSVFDKISPVLNSLTQKGIFLKTSFGITEEPSFDDFETILAEAKNFNADCIAGIGGGSVMDVAKIVAALLYSNQKIRSVVGNGKIRHRKTHLICIPTTSGTGSEVSPNALLMDIEYNTKMAVVSPILVPDSVYIDPSLTLSLPPAVTAYTGIDALTHCIEAYINRFAHPMIDVFALEGIRLITANLKIAFHNGEDLESRSKLSLGSLYGGMCLGPVNTAAVHAMAYPLGGEFKIGHGLSIALLLPYVMDFNLHGNETRYAEIALAMGVKGGKSDFDIAVSGIASVRKLISDLGIPSHLSDMKIPFDAIAEMSQSVMSVQRLLKNNPKEISLDDVQSIYKAAY
jgi:alcohol dehydrogenase class IV